MLSTRADRNAAINTPRRLSFGIKTAQHHTNYEDMLRVWREADRIPLIEHAWLFDHFIPQDGDPTDPCLEGWSLLAAFAAQTERLRLGIMVTGNTYRHPAVLAILASTVDHIAHGRLDFGIGAAWNAVEHRMYGIALPLPAERIRRLDESCELIRRLWTEPTVTFDGRYYHLTDARCEPKPVQTPYPPFVIGGGGEQLMLKVVARHADIWNIIPRSVEEFQRKSSILDGYCTAIGRDAGSIRRSIQVAVQPNEFDAARETLAEYIGAGAHHLILELIPPYPSGVAHKIAQEIIGPLQEV